MEAAVASPISTINVIKLNILQNRNIFGSPEESLKNIIIQCSSS